MYKSAVLASSKVFHCPVNFKDWQNVKSTLMHEIYKYTYGETLSLEDAKVLQLQAQNGYPGCIYHCPN
jgi:hypothetical protein